MSKKLVIILLVAILLGSSWALLKPGFFKIHDFTHAARVVEMTRALNDGHFPVRWTENFGFGYGMPLYEFYGPLPFYFGSFFYWLGLDIIFVLKLMFLTANLLTLTGAYFLGKKLFSKSSGVLLAAAFTLAPYRAVNLFVRGALSEAWGMMTLPWILWSLAKVIDQEEGGKQQLIISLFVLFLSHNLSVLIFAPFASVFALVYLFKQNQKNHKVQWKLVVNRLRDLTLAGLAAFGLAAFYLIPAFFEKDLTKVSQIVLGDYFNFRLHFLYLRQFFQPNWGYRGSEWGPDDGFSFFLGYIQLVGLGLSVLVLVRNLIQQLFINKTKVKIFLKNQLIVITSLLMMLISLLLTTEKTLFIWKRFVFLEFIQFPWRFMIIATLFLSLALSSLSLFFKKQTNKNLITIGFCVTLIGLNFNYFKPESYLDDPQKMYYTDAKRIRHEMSGILPDYIPQKLVDEPKPVDQLVLSNQDPAKYQILVDRTHQKLIRTDFSQPTQLDLAVADFPGWIVQLNGKFQPKVVSQRGNLMVSVPAGEQQIGLIFGYTRLRLISDLISLGSGLIVIYLLISSRKLKSSND